MAADPAELRNMEAFVRALFQEKPDLSILTNAIVREKYLLHAGRKSMAEEEKEQLRQLVEKELDQMEEEDSASGVEFVAEFKTRINSRIQKRPRYNSDTSDEELKIQELKKQRTGSRLVVSSEGEDSGIDSKKMPLRCSPSSFSDQGDSGAERQAGGSESGGQRAKKRRREPPQSGESSKPTREQRSRRQGERSGSESKETTEEEQSELEEIGKQKTPKGQRIESGSDSEQEPSNHKPQKRKGFGKQQKGAKEVVGKGKNRNVYDRRRKKEGELEEAVPKAGKTYKGARVDWSESEEETEDSGRKKAQKSPRQKSVKAQKEREGEDESESNSEDEQPSRQNKMRRISKASKQSVRRAEELGRDSDSARSKSWAKEKMQGAGRRASEKWSHNSESGSEDDGEFKRQASKEMKKAQTREELEEKKPRKRSRSREESEGETSELKCSERKRKGTRKSRSSEDELCSGTEETKRGTGKATMSGSSDKSEDGSEEWERGNQGKKRELTKKGRSVSGSECSSEEESLSKKGEESQGKHEKDPETDSEDSGSELVGRERSLQKTGIQKPQRRREANFSSGDEDDHKSSKRKGKVKEHHPSSKHEEHSSIRRLKRYIRECGAHRNYKKLLAGCHSRKAQVKVLKEELENLGLKGTPSLAKCRTLKKKRETAAEVASLDLCNIIATEGRPRRRNAWSLYSKPEQPSPPEESPVHSPIRHWSRLKDVISSDGESD